MRPLAPWCLLLAVAFPLFAAPPPDSGTDENLDLFLPSKFAGARLSPTGEFLAFKVLEKGRRLLGVHEFKTGELKLIGDKKVQPLRFLWKGPRRLMILRASPELDEAGYSAIDVDGSHVEDLWALSLSGASIVDALPHDPAHVLGWQNRRLHRVSIAARESSEVEAAGMILRVYDDEHHVRAGLEQGDKAFFFRWRSAPGAKWQERKYELPGPLAFPIGRDEDPRFVWLSVFPPEGEAFIERFDTTNGTSQVALRRPGLDPTGFLGFPDTGVLIGAIFDQGAETRLAVLNPRYRAALTKLQSRCAAFNPRILGALPDGHSWLLWMGNSRLPGAYVVFNYETGEISPLLMEQPGLNEDALAPAEFFAYERAGRPALSGRLWRPAEGGPRPLLIFCPSHLPQQPAADLFDPYEQALVRAGFAVVEINTVGTFGFGVAARTTPEASAFPDILPDLEEAVQRLAADGAIDAKRIGLVGVGLGSSLALHVASRSKTFGAIALIEPPAKLSRYELLGFNEDPDAIALSARLGGWFRTGAVADELSPVALAPKVTIPALYLCPEEGSFSGHIDEDGRTLRRAAEKAGAPASFAVSRAWRIHPAPELTLARERALVAKRLADFFREKLAAPR